MVSRRSRDGGLRIGLFIESKSKQKLWLVYETVGNITQSGEVLLLIYGSVFGTKHQLETLMRLWG